MVDTKTLRDYLKTQLAAASGLTTVKSWSNAEPRVFPGSPFGWVRPLGGAVEAGIVGSRKTIDNFEVVVIVKSGNTDKAEDDALGFKEAVETYLASDPTLNGQVSSAHVSARESYQVNDTNASFSAWKVTVTTWRFS